MIILTSNIGSRTIASLGDGTGLGVFLEKWVVCAAVHVVMYMSVC